MLECSSKEGPDFTKPQTFTFFSKTATEQLKKKRKKRNLPWSTAQRCVFTRRRVLFCRRPWQNVYSEQPPGIWMFWLHTVLYPHVVYYLLHILAAATLMYMYMCIHSTMRDTSSHFSLALFCFFLICRALSVACLGISDWEMVFYIIVQGLEVDMVMFLHTSEGLLWTEALYEGDGRANMFSACGGGGYVPPTICWLHFTLSTVHWTHIWKSPW